MDGRPDGQRSGVLSPVVVFRTIFRSIRGMFIRADADQAVKWRRSTPKHTPLHHGPGGLSFSRFAASFHPPVASAPPLYRRGVPSDRPASKDPDAPNPLQPDLPTFPWRGLGRTPCLWGLHLVSISHRRGSIYDMTGPMPVPPFGADTRRETHAFAVGKVGVMLTEAIVAQFEHQQRPLMSSTTDNPRERAMSCVFGPSIWAPHWREMRLRDGWVGSG